MCKSRSQPADPSTLVVVCRPFLAALAAARSPLPLLLPLPLRSL